MVSWLAILAQGLQTLQYGNYSSRQGLVPSKALNQSVHVECSQALKLFLVS